MPIESSFRQIETKGELFAALVRVIPAAVIVFSGWISLDSGRAGHPLVMVGFLYILVSLIGIVFALIGYFRVWLPYLYSLADTAAIAFALTMLAKMHHLDLVHEFSMPIFTLIYVVLTHSALRYRPALVLFGTSAFLIFLLFFSYLFVDDILHPELRELPRHFENIFHDIGYLPILFLVLTTILLFLNVRRTRELAKAVLVNGRRAGQLSRFFSPDIVNRLVSSSEDYKDLNGRQKVVVIFVDIRGFSKFSEQNTPDDVAKVLGEFRTLVCDIVFRHGGTIDKFIGDAVLAVFGTPISEPDDAKRAVRAIIEIDELVNKNTQATRPGYLGRITVGIGGHFGEVFVGIIESGKIIEHTIIGNAVNIAQRIERQTRELNTNFVISDDLKVASQLPELESVLVARKDVALPGIDQHLNIWIQNN